jgi:hypothetical protein
MAGHPESEHGERQRVWRSERFFQKKANAFFAVQNTGH